MKETSGSSCKVFPLLSLSLRHKAIIPRHRRRGRTDLVTPLAVCVLNRFTVSKANLIKANSEGLSEVKGNGGSYFPVTAVQNWCMQSMRIQNGIFILGLVSMVFSGDFEIAYDRILYFDFDRLDLKLGPLAFGFDLPANETRVGKKRPFFVFLYADDEVCIARGRGGGIAVWKKVDRQYREDEGVYV